jgi:hypothetical protein
MRNSLFERTFLDGNGDLAIAQIPNLPIMVWVAATLLKLIIKSGHIYLVLDTIAFGSLFTWAWLELFQGVNYFRQGLGLVVLIGTIVHRVQQLQAVSALK